MSMEEDVDMTLTVLWTEKDTHPIAECTRLQISLTILFFCSTGARIGTIFPEGGKKYEKGLRYKVRLQGQILQMLIVVQDLQVALHRKENKFPKMALTLSQRWLKNNPNPETNAYIFLMLH
jgi:hypothetical protein